LSEYGHGLEDGYGYLDLVLIDVILFSLFALAIPFKKKYRGLLGMHARPIWIRIVSSLR